MQRNMGIPRLNHYGLPLKRTRMEMFFFIILSLVATEQEDTALTTEVEKQTREPSG